MTSLAFGSPVGDMLPTSPLLLEGVEPPVPHDRRANRS